MVGYEAPLNVTLCRDAIELSAAKSGRATIRIIAIFLEKTDEPHRLELVRIVSVTAGTKLEMRPSQALALGREG